MSEIWNLSTLCRCCHADGLFKNLSPLNDMKNGVVYEKMLCETLGLYISKPELDASHAICEDCVQRLHNASQFKQQVLLCEQKFLVYCSNELVTSNVKVEQESSNDEEEHADNDHFDTAQQQDDDLELEIKIKNEEEELEKPKVVKENEKDVIPSASKNNINSNEDKKKRNISYRPKKCIIKILLDNLDNSVSDLIIIEENRYGWQYKCKSCDIIYTNSKELMSHLDQKHNLSYKCTQCNINLESHSNYLDHLKKTHGLFTCNMCKKSFKTKWSLQTHEKTHEDKNFVQLEKKLQCDTCQKFFINKSTIVKHIKLQHLGILKKHLCHLCGHGFSDTTNLRKHIETRHLKLRPYTCNQCGKRLASKKTFKKHIKNHELRLKNTKPYPCDKCPKSFYEKRGFLVHQMLHENKFMCRHCRVVYDDRSTLLTHIRDAHLKAITRTTINCEVCGLQMTGNYSYKIHLLSHHEKTFSCEKCGQRFSQKAALMRHMRNLHEEVVKKIKGKCEICNRSVPNIVTHMENHEKVRPTCEFCGKSFTTSELNRHKQEKHFGRTFDCEYCLKKYIKKRALQNHQMKQHGVEFKSIVRRVRPDDATVKSTSMKKIID